MSARKGAILPKNVQSLIGRQVYWAINSTRLAYETKHRELNVTYITPYKLYTLIGLSTRTHKGNTFVLSYIKDDLNNTLTILIGNLTCPHLDNRYHWSLKQLPAALATGDKSNDIT
jgi:hypothetical protein